MRKEMKNGTPEALHDVCQDKAIKTSQTFVNPGTPEAALVKREDMMQATLRGNGSDVLRENIIK